MMYIEEGFLERTKKISAIRMLGSGMNVNNEINPFLHEIVLMLLLAVFKRELADNSSRTRDDMVVITGNILKEMKLNATIDMIERIVDGALWYGEPERQMPFSCTVFNEVSGTREPYYFRFFNIDREHSKWDRDRRTVYMLTKEAQEIVFITREILEEYGFDVEQFYTLQLIKSGNFNKALDSINNLIARVRTLIRKEKDYREDLKQNPQIVYFDKSRDRRKSDEDIKSQFEDEKKTFEEMLGWKNRLENFPKAKKDDGEKLFSELEKARTLHNILAKLVIDNMAMEVKLRVYHPESFWTTSRISFKKDFWKNLILKEGLPHINLLESVLNPLFSPGVDFIFPLPWAWEEQILYKDPEEQDDENDAVPPPESVVISTDWEIAVELWEPIFEKIMVEGNFCISELRDIGYDQRKKWLCLREGIDLFMMFAITEIKLKEGESQDERNILFDKLCKKNHSLKKLESKTIACRIEKEQNPIIWDELYISPYCLYVKGGL